MLCRSPISWRKLFAVTKRSVNIGSTRDHQVTVSLDSEDNDEFYPLLPKKLKTEKKLDLILGDVGVIKDTLTDMVSLTKDTKVPLGLNHLLQDTLQCCICHIVPIRPSLIVGGTGSR